MVVLGKAVNSDNEKLIGFSTSPSIFSFHSEGLLVAAWTRGMNVIVKAGIVRNPIIMPVIKELENFLILPSHPTLYYNISYI
jgi:hypothetical protein